MFLRAIQAVLFLWCLLSYDGVESRKLSREEELELEKQLDHMNKSTIKTIKTIHGDMYNCIGFYQQPAFQHPLMKNRNHTFDHKMKPPIYPKNRRSGDDLTIIDPRKIWLNGKGCPTGTVPIKKYTKDDLIRAKLAAEIHSANSNPQTAELPGLHLAVIRTKDDPSRTYQGGGMMTSAHKLQIQYSQSSYGRMKIQNGADYIEVGQMVNPLMYNDMQTRSYIYTNVGNLRCFNLFCPGYVHTSKDIPIDQVLTLSRRGGPIYGAQFCINRALRGDWYLYVGEQSTVIGYWDFSIFTHGSGLHDFAARIEWGGQVYGPTGLPSAPMGTGYGIVGNPLYDAFFRQVIYAVTNASMFADADYVEEFADINDTYIYRVLDRGNLGGIWGHTVHYGGKGGYVGN